MIIEMRTYTLKPGNIPTFEERFASALHVREKYSKLAAFWHTEVGPLNQVIHVWPYDSLDQRASVRAEASKAEGWPPNTRELTIEQKSEIFLPAAFSPPLEPRTLGGIYEIRMYTYAPGTLPAVMSAGPRRCRGASRCRRLSAPGIQSWAASTSGVISGPTRMPASARASAPRRYRKACGHPAHHPAPC
jgi:hypothetical protein